MLREQEVQSSTTACVSASWDDCYMELGTPSESREASLGGLPARVRDVCVPAGGAHGLLRRTDSEPGRVR
jgi:hypothetical protein